MAAIDRYIDELRRSGDTSLILQSDTEPRVKGKSGERPLKGKTDHKAVTTLVEEIVPPECFADLVMMEPVEFVHKHEAGELAVRVVPGPSIWRVTLDVRGDALAPLAPEAEADAAAGTGASPRPDGAAPGATPSSKSSWSEIEQIVGPDGEALGAEGGPEPGASKGAPHPLDAALEEAALDATRGDDDVPLSEALLRDEGDDLGEVELDLADDSLGDEDPADVELAAFVPPREEELELDEGDEPGEEGQRQTTRLEREAPGADSAPEEPEEGQRQTTRLEREAPGADPASEEPEEGQRQTTRLEREAPGADSAPEEPEPDEDHDDHEAPRTPVITAFLPDVPPEAVGGDEAEASENADTGEHEAVRPLRPVEPLEIDFSEEDVPHHSIGRLDSLLTAAWAEGATGVLLREGRVPQMVRAGPLRPVPLASVEQGHLAHDILDIVASPSQVEQLELRGQCRFVYVTGAGTRVRCTLIKDGGKVVASVRRIGDEHLPQHAEKWLSQAVQRLLPPTGLVLVCGGAGQGKTTTAAALATMCHGASQQTLVVAEPLERRLPDEGAGLLQRHIPLDVPNGGQALADAHTLEAPLVLVDLPHPQTVALDLLALAGQGRLVISTWTAEHAVEAIQGLMDALPAELAPAERARRVRSLAAVVSVHLLPAKGGGVVPIFEALKTYPAVLTAIAECRLDEPSAGELLTLSFQASRNALKARGII